VTQPCGRRGHCLKKVWLVLVSAFWLASGIALCPLSAVRGAETLKRVLVVYENNRILPANIEGDRGLNEAIASSGRAVSIRAEFLDYPDFGGVDYVETITGYLLNKYAVLRPDLIVAGGNGALEFLVRNRARLFTGIPVVYMGVDKEFAERLKLPKDIYGIPVQYDPIGTIDQALKWHPKASHLAVVTGVSEDDRGWEALLRRELPRFEDRVGPVEFISGLSNAEVKRKVGELGMDTIIFTPGYFQDGAGQTFAPRQAASEIAAAARVPVYGPYSTFIGTGVVGGRVPTFLSMGQAAGNIVNQLLDGRTAGELELPAVMPTMLSVDWRQIQRWGISEDAIPPDSIVQFKVPGFWDQYKVPALITLVVVLLQSALLAGLLIERRRRRRAEVKVDKHRFELAHASRLAIAGELTASIAHEINQPLGAIHSNVAAASLMLEAGEPLSELRQILEDIRRDNVRASDVVRQLRKFVEKHEVDHKLVNLNNSAADMQVVLRAEAQRRHVDLQVRQQGSDVEVIGDRIQIQQVLINLVLNAMDAVAGETEGRRTVLVIIAKSDDTASISVVDTGHGIASDHEDKLFDSFFSTKQSGIGLGLSIVRTLVEAHGGMVWAQNQPSGGAAFHVEFPLAREVMKRKVA
jgi:signal transduction histidine kinase